MASEGPSETTSETPPETPQRTCPYVIGIVAFLSHEDLRCMPEVSSDCQRTYGFGSLWEFVVLGKEESVVLTTPEHVLRFRGLFPGKGGYFNALHFSENGQFSHLLEWALREDLFKVMWLHNVWFTWLHLRKGGRADGNLNPAIFMGAKEGMVVHTVSSFNGDRCYDTWRDELNATTVYANTPFREADHGANYDSQLDANLCLTPYDLEARHHTMEMLGLRKLKYVQATFLPKQSFETPAYKGPVDSLNLPFLSTHYNPHFYDEAGDDDAGDDDAVFDDVAFEDAWSRDNAREARSHGDDDAVSDAVSDDDFNNYRCKEPSIDEVLSPSLYRFKNKLATESYYKNLPALKAFATKACDYQLWRKHVPTFGWWGIKSMILEALDEFFLPPEDAKSRKRRRCEC
jgi:hypothetical protein